jgi:phospholipid/cholesterol/gamma-HCH transport system substrate-binding protein
MSDYTRMEIVTGIFVVLGLGALGYLSISIGGIRVGPRDAYRVTARFSNVGDLKARAPVKVAGVNVGRVETIRLADYYGEVQLSIARDIVLPKDTIASIATSGLLGESYVALSPGGAEGNLSDGGRITHTEPAINISDLIGRTAFGTASGDDKSGKAPAKAADGGAR